jgi:hypothetical protein
MRILRNRRSLVALALAYGCNDPRVVATGMPDATTDASAADAPTAGVARLIAPGQRGELARRRSLP